MGKYILQAPLVNKYWLSYTCKDNWYIYKSIKILKSHL